MISLFVLVAPPRSGTTWFARLLTHENVVCHHELALTLQPHPVSRVVDRAILDACSDHTVEQLQRRRFLEGFPHWFARLLEHQEHGRTHAGDACGSALFWAHGVALLWPQTRFVLSTRDGINHVQSLHAMEARANPVARALRSLDEQGTDEFEVACRRWTRMIASLEEQRRALAAAGAATFETTLERVTSDQGELERMWRFVAGDWERHAEHALSLMRTPVNVLVNSEVAALSAADVWAAWTDEQRAVFQATCGETQRRLGYPVPSA